jgi:hypothetical protein
MHPKCWQTPLNATKSPSGPTPPSAFCPNLTKMFGSLSKGYAKTNGWLTLKSASWATFTRGNDFVPAGFFVP